MGIAYGQVFGRKHHNEQVLTDSVPESAIGYKRCVCCGVVKKFEEFRLNIEKRDGRDDDCIECQEKR